MLQFSRWTEYHFLLQIKAIHQFYDGLPDQDLTMTQEDVERGCQATEHVYQVFGDVYGYCGQEFFPWTKYLVLDLLKWFASGVNHLLFWRVTDCNVQFIREFSMPLFVLVNYIVLVHVATFLQEHTKWVKAFCRVLKNKLLLCDYLFKNMDGCHTWEERVNGWVGCALTAQDSNTFLWIHSYTC